MGKNTKLHLMYRDASNYKVFNEYVLEGRMTKAQYKAIAQTLDDGVFCIADQVGLIGGVDLMIRKGYEVGEDDHCYTTMTDFDGDSYEELQFTDDPATDGLTVNEVVKRFVQIAGNWDLDKEIQRTGVLTFG